MNKQKLVIASAYAATTTIAAVIIVTIWAEYAVSLKDWLKNFSGHHWTSKSIFSVVLYLFGTIILYCAPIESDSKHIKRSLSTILVSTILGTIILTGFFAGHHYHIL